MARLKDKTSNRQKGYVLLNKMKSKPRAECLDILMDKLGIEKPYASTLYADHRRNNKDAGKMTTVYRILEKPTGRHKVIKPYVSQTDVFKPKKSDFRTADAAINAYVTLNAKKTETALKLKA